MGKSEDEQRAARARERAKEERAEVEAEAQGREREARLAREKTDTLLRSSCHPLWRLASEDFGITIGVTLVLAFGVAVTLFFEADVPAERPIALAIMGIAVVLATVALLVRVNVRARVNAAWDLEAAWLGKLPFAVTGLERGVASTSSNHRLVVKVSFQVTNEMPLEKARQMLVHVDPGGKASRDGVRLELTARVAGDPEGDVPRVKARRLLLHDLVDGVLLPLHAEAPITGVELDD